jgi:G3E family GTPase
MTVVPKSTAAPPIRFILLGGFLGAGKTTTIARLARHYQAAGLNVAIITNDKAADLVDTLNLRGQGFHVGELPGVCFCGNVEELVRMTDDLGLAVRPDVVLAEPVGSCLDLTATVIRPLRQSFGARFEIAPYGVLVKPMHAAKILRNEPDAGVAPKAAYLFLKQIEEADFAVINRADQVPTGEVDELARLLRERFPQAPVVAMSAKTGDGFDAFLELLERDGEFGRRVVELDDAAYAAGEAELGWLNGSLLLAADEPFDVDRFLLEALGRIRGALRAEGAATAHLKLIALWSGRHATANLVSNDAEPELSHASGGSTTRAQLVVNARVACDPDVLRRYVDDGLQAAATSRGGKIEVVEVQSFCPGAPAPAVRLSNFLDR